MEEILLVTISGRDRTGLTTSFAKILGDAGTVLLDIGQAVIHDELALGLMVRAQQGLNMQAAEEAIQFKAHELGVTAHVSHVSEKQYREWVQRQHRRRFIVAMLAPRITAAQIAAVTESFVRHGLNIDIMDRLSARNSAWDQAEPRMCIEFTVSGDDVDGGELRRTLLALAGTLDCDIAVQEDSIFRRNRRLVAFDMDSTLIQMEVIDELARIAGVGEQVSAITASAMRGELDFEGSFRKRVGLLKGLPVQVMEEIAGRLPITAGAHRLLQTLKALGYKTAILSGGFTRFAQHLQGELGFDYIFANELAVAEGALTGEPLGTIVTGERKAELLRQIAAKEGIAMEQTIAVGDGANDLPMLSIAGLGVAFHAKPLVREKAQHSISIMGLDAVLYLLGLRDRHTEERRAKT